MGTPTTFVDMCVKELELCGVKEGETVAVLSQLDERLDYADAFMAAAGKLGATTYHVRLPEASSSLLGDAGAWTVGVTPLAGNDAAMDSLKRADLVIDLMFLLFSKEQLEIQEAGARMLLCVEPIEHLVQLFPTRSLRERVAFGGELLGKSSELRFTNPAGSDVRYRLGTYPVI